MAHNERNERIQRQHAQKLVERYEEMLSKDQSLFFDQSSFLDIITYYEHLYQNDKALAVIELALAQHPYSADFLIRKAQAMAQNKCYEEAMALLEQASILAPSEIEIILLKADIFVSNYCYAEAVEVLEASMLYADKQDKIAILLGLSETYEAWGNNPQLAFEFLREALLMEPTHEEALTRIDCCVENTENYEASVKLHQWVIDQEPYCYLAWYNLGNAYKGLGLYEKAVWAYEFVPAIEEKFDLVYSDCADTYFLLEDYSKAINYYKDAQIFGEIDDELYYNIGKCCLGLNDSVQAIKHFKKALSLNKGNDEVHFALGKCYWEIESYREAMNHLDCAMKLEETNDHYISEMAKVQFETGNYETAVMLYNDAIKNNPKEQQYYYSLMHTYFQMGLYYDLLNTAEIAAEAFNTNKHVDILYWYAAGLFMTRQKSQGYLVLEEALGLNFQRSELFLQLLPFLEDDYRLNVLLNQYG